MKKILAASVVPGLAAFCAAAEVRCASFSFCALKTPAAECIVKPKTET